MNLIDTGKASTSLLDVFMPNDLCARCDDAEAAVDMELLVRRDQEVANLHFCSERCMDAFVRGAEAVKELPDVF